MPACPFCGNDFDSRGLRLHIVYCKSKNASTPQPGTQTGAQRLSADFDQLPDANDQEVIQTLALQRELKDMDLEGMVVQKVEEHISKVLEEAEGEGGTIQDHEEEEVMKKELEEIRSEVRTLLSDIGEEVSNIGETVGSSETALRELSSWTKKRLMDMEENLNHSFQHWTGQVNTGIGKHLDDINLRTSRSVDALNARLTQTNHHVQSLMELERARNLPPTQPEEDVEPSPLQAEIERNLEPVEVSPMEPMEEITIVGECSGSPPDHHFIEQKDLEEHPNLRRHRKCPLCGAKLRFYKEPKKLKTKEGVKPKPEEHLSDFIGACQNRKHFFTSAEKALSKCPTCGTAIKWFKDEDEQARTLASVASRA